MPFALRKIHRCGDFYVLVVEKRGDEVRMETFSDPKVALEAKKDWDGSFPKEALRSAVKAPKGGRSGKRVRSVEVGAFRARRALSALLGVPP